MSYHTLTSVRPPDTETLELPARSELARLSTVSRLQLRLGLWLLLHAARHRAESGDRDAHSLRREQLHARARRDQATLRTHALHTVRS